MLYLDQEKEMTSEHDRFWKKVNKSKGCWLWTASSRDGYGQFKSIQAHRYSYKMSIGPIPKGQQVRHICHNKKCVRPEHLYLTVSNKQKTHCPKGHPYRGDNLKKVQGRRRCRECYNSQRMKRYYENKK